MKRQDAIPVAPGIDVDPADVMMTAVRASGAGGQNVNKVSTAIHLRYDLRNARLPDYVRARLLKSGDRRISDEGVLVIKAQSYRTQALNREDALQRLVEVLRNASVRQKLRRPTRPTRGSQERRIEKKKKLSKNKKLRQKPSID